MRDLQDTIEAWGALADAGWLPIGDHGGGVGPLCLDLRARTENGDAPVVWFEHEDLYSVGRDHWTRAELAARAFSMYPSFESLLSDIPVSLPL